MSYQGTAVRLLSSSEFPLANLILLYVMLGFVLRQNATVVSREAM